MRSYFPDVNVWLALAYDGHEHHAVASRWFGRADGTIRFCRSTQLSFLRLLTNQFVMGAETRTPKEAWETLDQLSEDERVFFAVEPEGQELESSFRELTSQHGFKGKDWPDMYLAAFAQVAGLTLVTFDRRLHRGSAGALLLS
jgi:toxin-antitoxin system PIN domain toxin